MEDGGCFPLVMSGCSQAEVEEVLGSLQGKNGGTGNGILQAGWAAGWAVPPLLCPAQLSLSAIQTLSHMGFDPGHLNPIPALCLLCRDGSPGGGTSQ